MTRIIITQIILFLLPFFAFAVYRTATVGWAGFKATDWSRVTFGLVTVGLVLCVASFIALALIDGTETGVYVPAQFEDGRLIPGHFRDPE